eukprot:Pgem_evm1s7234
MPSYPLHVPERQVDVVFNIDSSADDENSLPNGDALISIADLEYSRKLGLPHPAVPTKEQFANPANGLLNKTTFFGCFDKTAPTV